MDTRLLQETCAILKRELKSNHISYKALANELNISEVSVKRLLNNIQPLSMQRMMTISQLVNFPLSKILAEAERNAFSIPLFTSEQDLAFCDCPALFTFWTELSENNSPEEIGQRHELDDASLYQYLRKLENFKFIELQANNNCKVLVPAHTAFEKGAKFSSFFTHQVLNGLKERVVDIPLEDDQAFLISLKAELTKEEFAEVSLKLEEWMFNKLRESQNLKEREGLKVSPYTFGFMGAQGAFHGEMPKIPKIKAFY
ncbi:helix-turn-helix domain-containing protein [Vibrio penaeicida]|uniref:helix-turn-helix domain-containing protein n=1 Tax=Vibrio penaeicida TaxID=104609 RepID=UPI000CEA2F24|nr:helix-turn-helix transcriptional regulator [Vibrio penaeicida]